MVPTHLDRPVVNRDAVRSYLIMHQGIASAVRPRLTRVLVRAEGSTSTVLRELLDDVELEQAWVQDLMVLMQMPPAYLKAGPLVNPAGIYPLASSRAQPLRSSVSSIVEVETLINAVTAKIALWHTLASIADALPVARHEIVVLSRNADRQHRDLLGIKDQLTRSVFLTHDTATP